MTPEVDGYDYHPLDPELVRADASSLLMLARLESVRISPSEDGERIRVWSPRGPGVVERWKPFLAAKKTEVLGELLDGTCDRCGERGRPLTAVYWNESVYWVDSVLCEECIASRTEKFNREGWPEARWGDDPREVEEF